MSTTGIAYTFSIDEVSALTSVESYSNVIYKVTWTYTGISTLGVSASIGPLQINLQFDPNNVNDFIDSSSLTKTVVKGWVEQHLQHMIPTMQENIANQITSKGIPYKVVLDLPD